MDPVTVIGLLASIANLVDATRQTLHLVARFKDGEADMRTLSRDLLLFVEALNGFERVLRSRQTTHRVSPHVIEGMLRDSLDTVTQLEERLQNISASSLSIVRRAQWLHQSAAIEKSHDRLRDLNSMLHVFLSIAHTEAFFAAASQPYLFAISAKPDGEAPHSETPSVSPRPIPKASNVPRRLSDTSLLSSPESNSGSTMSTRASLTLVASAPSDSSQSNLQPSSPPPPSPTSPKARPPKQRRRSSRDFAKTLDSHTGDMLRQSCQYLCFCDCHKLDARKLKQGVRKQGKTRIKCTDPSCKMNLDAQSEFGGKVKSFLKTFSGVMFSHSVKIRYDLNTYRSVYEGSDAMRYIKHGNMEKLKASIESGETTIWDTAPDGWNLLHTAAYNRQLPIVKYLLSLGVDTDSGDVGSRRPADLAILKSINADATETEHEIVEVFSKEDDYLRDFEFTPIHLAALGMYAAEDTERPTLSQLIELVDEANNAPVDTDWSEWRRQFTDRSPMYGEILEYFRSSAYELPQGAKVIHNLIDRVDKKYYWTPLHWAASAGRVETMETLIHHGADPLILSNLNANIIHAAAETKSDHGITGALAIWKRCSDQLNINQQNRWMETPLHVASWYSPSCVKGLLEAGAALDVQQEDGQVALHCAGLMESSADRTTITSLLCGSQNKAHINIQDSDGRPPLFDFLDDPECVKILLRHGAKLDLVDAGGMTCFHRCCSQDDNATLDILLESMDDGKLAAAKDLEGNTPLMVALSNSHVQCARQLLKLDDVGDVISNEGWAPIHYAAKIGDCDLLEAVLKHPSFIKGMRTIDGKRAETIAMESNNWSGTLKELIKEYDYFR